MRSKEKQAELERYRTLLLETLDYHLEHYTGGLVFDEWDPAAEWYLQQKQQTEKYFQQGRLDRLDKMLSKWSKHLSDREDLNFTKYIKEKTGYDINIFANLREQVDRIVAEGKIASDIEAFYVSDLYRISRQIPEEKEKADRLESLIRAFYKPKLLNSQFGEEGILNNIIVVDGGVFEPNSPDGRRKVVVENSGKGEYALTYVVIHVNGGSGSIYCAKGQNLPVKVLWKDNNTVVIETKKDYETSTRHHRVLCHQDVITIEYSEI